MLMMFGHAIRKAPYERAIPFNSQDLLILVNPSIGIRLCNITSETGETFKIFDFMKSEPEVFGKDAAERVSEIADVFEGRVERFFVTKKSPYVFFDAEEQRHIRKMMSRPGISCSVEIYKYNAENKAEKMDLLDFELDDSKEIIKFFNACYIRAVINCTEYYLMAKPKHDEYKGRQSKYNPEVIEKETLDKLFLKYKKLSSIKSKDRVRRYFKLLFAKYHPDNVIYHPEYGGGDEVVKEIGHDLEFVKTTKWYNQLPQTVDPSTMIGGGENDKG